jgi:hypothetical protein
MTGPSPESLAFGQKVADVLPKRVQLKDLYLTDLHKKRVIELIAEMADAHVAERTAAVAKQRDYWMDEYYDAAGLCDALRAAADAMAEANSPAQFERARAAYRALSPVGEAK